MAYSDMTRDQMRRDIKLILHVYNLHEIRIGVPLKNICIYISKPYRYIQIYISIPILNITIVMMFSQLRINQERKMD